MRHARFFRCKAFTLIELLVVIAIIALIAGMLLPVLNNIKRYTKKTKARELMSQIETSFKQYLVDYRKFPDLDITTVDSNVLDVLRGATYNDLGHRYMDVTTNELASGGMFDPWNRIYMLSIDNGKGGDTTGAYDSKVAAGPYGVIAKEIVLWSKGEDGSDASGSQKDDVRSWK